MTTSTNIAALLCAIAFVAVSSDSATFTCTDVQYQSCSRVCSDRIVEGLEMEHGACTDDCEGQTVDCETVRMPNPFAAKKEEPRARKEEPRARKEEPRARSEGGETDLTVFTCTDVEFQSCSRVCSDRIVEGLDVDHGECTDDCEGQTVDCETVRMPNPFAAKKEEPRARKEEPRARKEEPRARSEGGETDPSAFTCTDVQYQSCSRVCSDRIVEGLEMEHGACTDECEGQTVDCETVRMPNPFAAKKEEPRARKEEPRARSEGGETDLTVFTCTDVEFQSCSRVCSDRIVDGLDVEHGACTDECEEQTLDCETVRMPNPFAAKKEEPRARKEEPRARKEEPRARKEEPRARKEEPRGRWEGMPMDEYQYQARKEEPRARAHNVNVDYANAASQGTVQVSAFWVYTMAALLTVLIVVNVTCLVMQSRSNGKKPYEPVNYDSSV